MVHPWFFIRCPTCANFWGERGCFPPGNEIITPCLHCRREVAITYRLEPSGVLTIKEVSDLANGRRGGWSPLLDRRVHWKEVN